MSSVIRCVMDANICIKQFIADPFLQCQRLRNRVSLDHLCHPTKETGFREIYPVSNPVSFLGCWGLQKPGFFRPSLSPNLHAHRNPVSLLGCKMNYQYPGKFRLI